LKKIAFNADCLPLFLGSLPEMDDEKAFDLVVAYSPFIPNWSQMPGGNKREGMVAQFAPGLPGLKRRQGSLYVDNTDTAFQDEMLRFYETYLNATALATCLDDRLFALSPETARGFFAFMEQLDRMTKTPRAVKGQITGPFTLGTAIKDTSGIAIFHDDVLRDMIVKLLSLKARWQVEQLAAKGFPVIFFIDEPALAGFGTSEFISVSREVILDGLAEIIGTIHQTGGLAGIHVCANTDWSMLMDADADLISFDAYTYFDRLILYQDEIVEFMNAGKYLAWGIVPTVRADDIEKETVDSLTRQFRSQTEHLFALGIDPKIVLRQSLITPSCGTGALTPLQAEKILWLTKGVSDKMRREERYA
jgi:methionine synthase II (cobalamin-independent)